MLIGCYGHASVLYAAMLQSLILTFPDSVPAISLESGALYQELPISLFTLNKKPLVVPNVFVDFSFIFHSPRHPINTHS